MNLGEHHPRIIIHRYGRPAGARDLARLRMAMADAHPDRGGSTEAFMAARQEYLRAKMTAGR